MGSRPRPIRSSSLRESSPSQQSQHSDFDSDESYSDKMEGAGSWDVLDWTKFAPKSRSISHDMGEFLYHGEDVKEKREGTRNIIPLGTIPLATIDKFTKLVAKSNPAPRQSDKTPSLRLLQVKI
ncbi:hypothetical protein C5167_000896 [Papaver somniferum]|uniref:Uncharacterized protein n=1 Tax=Papaver somniferum TaxID=3469 RepID=A0A4Y7KXG7_PAPSO|nr:hypothetical protein C5167_000896 [Papaver somniferum]